MVKRVSLICALSCLAALGRIPLAAIPNVQLTTFFVLVSGRVFGIRVGMLVGVFAAISSNMFLGQGPWTIYQALGWGLAGTSAGLFGTFICNPYFFAAHAFAWGFLYGWITNLWHWYAFVYPHTWQTWLAVCAGSAFFDFSHAVCNLVSYLVLGPGVIAVMNRFALRMEQGS